MDNKKDFDADLIVVGGGPGGATCAAIAARAGLRVILVDQSAFPRDKVCGDAISGKTIGILRRLGLDQAFKNGPEQKLWGLTFSGPYGDSFTVPFKSNAGPSDLLGITSRRFDFDHVIVNCAVESGAELWANCRAEELVMDDFQRVNGVVIRDAEKKKRTILAPLVVGADGAYSIVSKEIGRKQLDPMHYCGGLRSYWQGVSGFKPGVIEIHFVDDVIPGYFWIFPLSNGGANVGLGMLSSEIKKRGVRLKALLDHVITLPQFESRFRNAQQIGKTVGWGLPMGSKRMPLSGEGWMLVGDAASLIDPFTGEGIGNAMISGDLAAQFAIKAHFASDYSLTMLSRYTDDVYEQLGDELQVSYLLQRLSRWKWLLNTVIKKASRNEELRNAITCMFDDLDSRRTLMGPGFYVRALFA